uniref:cell adhesion molecule 2 isoform X1 n=1 Tax=Ciona intestinalis TaxID=7719 RepID=UPI000180CC96|nr:cell adhesion molecule 2 isoform X1 [Ciona intestinalis]|eukprot:XP_002126544.1 cell adhesion molecule 2 isoform X1 [Ciona intestinalis]
MKLILIQSFLYLCFSCYSTYGYPTTSMPGVEDQDKVLGPAPACQSEGVVLLSGSTVNGVVTPAPTKTVTVYCDIVGQLPVDQSYHFTWSVEGEGLISYDDDVVSKGYQSRFIVANSPNEASRLALEINPVKLSDVGKYDCSIVGLYDHNVISSSFLEVNQLPNITVKVNDLTVVEGNEVILGTCYANASKPQPEIWIEDSAGHRVESLSSPSIVNHEEHAGVSDSVLKFSKVFNREENGESYRCMVQHPDNLETFSSYIGQVDVQFSPTVSIMGDESDISMEEGQSLSVVSLTTGNPTPVVVWTFQPDTTQPPATSADSTNPTDPPTYGLPANFQAAGNTLIGNPLSMIGNDGTFTCTVSNGLGSPASISFHLTITEKPTTTAAPTTPVATVGGHDSGEATKPLPRQAGADAAVIGGVVAVAVFVLIVAIIFLLRYFMTHKGEYYTNELKATDDARLENNPIDDEDDDLDGDEDQPLDERKRTEHFL